MRAWINGMNAVSPQNTFGVMSLPDELRESSGNVLKCIEPSYVGLIEPMAARRMSRIVKMGLASALTCLKQAGIQNPGAIITGTGLGCLEDTGKFLSSLYQNEEKLLNPTPFIQSTHNTVGAAIAQSLKCNSYNSTYCHTGHSFEHALTDALLMLAEGDAEDILVGGADELTQALTGILVRLSFLKRNGEGNTRLAESQTRGTIAGEGAAFFSLSGKKTDKSIAVIDGVMTSFDPAPATASEKITSELDCSPDLVIYGINGDVAGDRIYRTLMDSAFKGIPAAYYKHLCGEYDTSSSFAVWLAASMLNVQRIPDSVMLSGSCINPERILVYNHYRSVYHSAILISRC